MYIHRLLFLALANGFNISWTTCIIKRLTLILKIRCGLKLMNDRIDVIQEN